MTDFATLRLDTDTKGLKDGERDLRGVSDQAKRTAREVDSAATGMTSAFKRVGGALAAIGATTALAGFSRASVQAAIDAQEMESAFDVVFGNMASDVRSWAEETGNALGRSTQEIQRAALAFQELFGRALDPAQSAELSKQFAVLTQDLASFKNLSNEVAQQKLFSGLVGEAEPLRAVGVFLSENALQARAAAMGLGDFSKELTDQEKIVVRAAEIQAQLAMASGDVERTSGSTANQIKTYNAAVEELQVAIGQRLLPQLTPLVTLLADVATALASVVQSMNVTNASMSEFVAGVRVIAGWIGKGVTAFMNFTSTIGITADRLQWLSDKARFLINPLSAAISLIRDVGREYEMQTGGGSGGGGPIGAMTTAMMGMAKQAMAAASPPALPAVAKGIADLGKKARVGASAAREAEQAFKSLYDRLRPREAADRQLDADRKLIQSRKDLTQATKDELTALLELEAFRQRTSGLGPARVSEGLLKQGSLAVANGDIDKNIQQINAEQAARKILEETGNVAKSLEVLKQQSQGTTVTIADNFAQMSQRITSSLQGLANSIRSGNFLGIFSGILDIFMQLGSAGVFGKSIQTNLNRPVAGARAMGGQVNAGRTYLVGERGPELFTPSGHGRIIANDNVGGGMVFNIDARGATDPEAVRQQVQQGILEAAPSIVAAAEQRTISNLRRPRLAGVL